MNYVRDHITEIVDLGQITDSRMHASLLDELSYRFSASQDVQDVLNEYDLRETKGRRPIVGVIGRFLLLGRFHYMDAQIMLRLFQPIFAPDKLAYALGRDLVAGAYDQLPDESQDRFEYYDGSISRLQALRFSLGQTALVGEPRVTAIRQLDSPVTLLWLGDETRPNLAEFCAVSSTNLISHWQGDV